MCGHVLVTRVGIGLVAVVLIDPGAQAVRHYQFRHAIEKAEGASVGADPVGQGLAPGGLRVGVVKGPQHRHKDLRLADLPSGRGRSPARPSRRAQRTAFHRPGDPGAWPYPARPAWQSAGYLGSWPT